MSLNLPTRLTATLVLVSLLAIAFVTFLMGVSVVISSDYTIKQIENDVKVVGNYEKVNDLLINVTPIKEKIQNQTVAYEALKTLGIILAILIVVFLSVYLYLDKKDKTKIENLIPKWTVFDHLGVIVSVVIGVFSAICISFLSSMDSVQLIRGQAIMNTIAQTIDSSQPDVIKGVLIKYLSSSYGNYLTSSNGFAYFLISSILPAIGLLLFKIRYDRYSFWSLVFFTSTIVAIPFWWIFHLGT